MASRLAAAAFLAGLCASGAAACISMGVHPSMLCRIAPAGDASDDCARMLVRQVGIRLEKYAADPDRADKVNAWIASLLVDLKLAIRTAGMPPLTPGRPFFVVWGSDLLFMLHAPGDDPRAPDSLRIRAGYADSVTKVLMIPGSAMAGGFQRRGSSSSGIAVAVIPAPAASAGTGESYAVRVRKTSEQATGGVIYVDEDVRGIGASFPPVSGRTARYTVRLPSSPDGILRLE